MLLIIDFHELFSEHLIVCQLVDFWPCINQCDDISEGCKLLFLLNSTNENVSRDLKIPHRLLSVLGQ